MAASVRARTVLEFRYDRWYNEFKASLKEMRK